MNLKYQNNVGADPSSPSSVAGLLRRTGVAVLRRVEVTRLGSGERQGLLTSSPPIAAARSPVNDGAHGVTRPTDSPVTRHPSLVTCHAFTLVEILVVVVLLSFIILALMTVFNATQTAFRASLTQTDVMEGGRSAMGMIKNDLDSMTPSFGQSNQPAFDGTSLVPVNFSSFVVVTGTNTPLVQSLTGVSNPTNNRVNVLEEFFILSRQNTMWTGTGYFVDTVSTNYLNPLYRFSMTTNVMAADPMVLYNTFCTNLPTFTGRPISINNPSMSHLMDGVVHLTVRAYDPNGIWMTNGYPLGYTNTAKNAWFSQQMLGEAGFVMFSNTLPAAVEVNLGVLEDRVLQRAQSLPNFPPVLAQSNYLAQQAGKTHLFRQRFPIRNVDPSAYQ